MVESVDKQNKEFQNLADKVFGAESYLVDPLSSSTTVNATLEKEAESRASIISDLAYSYKLYLRKGKYFVGQATIKFTNTAQSAQTTWLNCSVLALSQVRLNQTEFSAEDNLSFEGHRLKFKCLAGENTLEF